MSGHTSGPWLVEEYDEYGGYDCMSGGIKAGPIYLDAANYGQTDRTIVPEQMIADARLIAAAPELLEALKRRIDPRHISTLVEDDADRELVAKAEARP
jgi:hypothetical protein